VSAPFLYKKTAGAWSKGFETEASLIGFNSGSVRPWEFREKSVCGIIRTFHPFAVYKDGIHVIIGKRIG
jgi:hypothetical protein